MRKIRLLSKIELGFSSVIADELFALESSVVQFRNWVKLNKIMNKQKDKQFSLIYQFELTHICNYDKNISNLAS